MSVDTITREEYRSKSRHQYAGTIRQLDPSAETLAAWQAANPDWLGKHWHMYLGTGGTTLAPCNVEPVTRKPKTA